MGRAFWVIFCLLAANLGNAQESWVPDRRVVVSRDVDFFGADLQSQFDTTYDACVQTCLADKKCAAFTFNTQAGACFPKSAVSERSPYDGAVSGEVYAISKATRELVAKRAIELSFLRESDFAQARDLASDIGRQHAGGPWSVEDMLSAAQDRRADGNNLSAMRWIGGAVAKADGSDLWVEYARLNAILKGETSSATRTFRGRALRASINGYLRAYSDPERVNALSELAQALEQQERGKASLRALRLAQSIRPRADVVGLLDKAVEKYGFRVSDHQIYSDIESPRMCAEFNEPLIKVGQDYSPFVKLPDQRLAVQIEDRQICVEGLTHGQRISVTFREGLPAESGETLAKDITLEVYVRDRSPKVGFAGRAYVLPRSADAGLPIETVNLDHVDLTLQRVSDRNVLRAIQDDYFGKPLSYWQLDDFDRDVAETIWTGKGDVNNELNQTMVTRLPLGDLVINQPAGVYALTADLQGADKYDETSSTQWFILSDIGMTSLRGTDGLHVFVRRLSNANAWPDAKVTLLSRANRVLGEAQSDAEGYARFDAGLTQGVSGASPALLMVQGKDDFSFLSLTDPAFDFSDRGVEGRPAAPPIDLFVTTDRGAYRAGETINVTALLRGDAAQALPNLPLTAILKRPDGVEYSRTVSTQSKVGGHVFSLPVGATVPRGAWSLTFKVDMDAPALATTKVLVEDFLPERIDFSLSLPGEPLSIEEASTLKVEARYLFGAPAADLLVEGQITLRVREAIEGFTGYQFGRYDAPFYGETEYFYGEETDTDGFANVSLILPEQKAEGRPLTAEISVRVLEGSGRPVERSISHPVAAASPMIGIKPAFGDEVVAEGSTATFDVVSLASDLTPMPMDVRWTVNRVTTRYQWYQMGSGWEWEPITTRRAVASGTAAIERAPISVGAAVEWGRYELVVEQQGGAYATSSTEFYAGWYAPVDASETPDTLSVSLDKAEYHSGETAALRLVPRYAGTALITVMSNRLISMKAVEVDEGENLIPLDVTDEWGAGAYVTASVIRPADALAQKNPMRAIGLSYAKIDPGAKQLQVALIAPEKVPPRGPLDVSISVAGIQPGESAFVTLAAVDVGILNLTRFGSPDPSEHYFGQRRLGMEMRDIYGRLINGLAGEMGALRSGGDANAGTSFDSPPPTEELVSFFHGPVQIGADGQAQVHFDLPPFNGAVRLMAVAWSETGVGQANEEVLVRDPVVVTASVPRFLAPGDQSRLLLEIVHAEGPSGRMGLTVAANGVAMDAAHIPSEVTLGDLETTRLSFPVTALEIGDHEVRVALTTPDGIELVKTVALPVRANDPQVSTTQQVELAAGESLALGGDLFADLRPGSGEVVVSSGALARFDAPGLLRSLDRYPYGCTEQVTSQSLPLLYFEDVATAMGLTVQKDVDARISQAISRVLARQASNGAFGLWRAESGDFWLDAYVSDFLSRARAKGHEVPDLAFRQAMDNLRNRVNYASEFEAGGEDLAYALLVLAREGAAAVGDLRYYADVKGTAFATPLAAAQLGAALSYYGDQTRADMMFRQAAKLIDAGRKNEASPLWRVDYGTRLRDTAGALTLALEAGSQALDIGEMVQQISLPGREMSTQESVWTLMAAHALIDDDSLNTLSINGVDVDGPILHRLSDGDAMLGASIRNEGSLPQNVTITSVGVPTYPISQAGYGYRIERAYFDLEGAPLSASTVQAGDRFVTVLTVKPSSTVGARLMINDPLPAGFEIDNPNLLASGDIRELPWLEPTYAEHSEFRSDRFLAAVDWQSDKPFQLAYIVRAVSPGAYHHPAASVEDMYRPQYRANTDAGRLTVLE